MEYLSYEFGPWGVVPNFKKKKPILVGVVGSGNLEILIEKKELAGKTKIELETSVRGYKETWAAVLTDFAESQQFPDTLITINDGGATPAVVQLRLSQGSQQWRDENAD